MVCTLHGTGGVGICTVLGSMVGMRGMVVVLAWVSGVVLVVPVVLVV